MSGVEAALPVHDRACPPARPVEVRSGTPRSGDPNGQCETFSLRRSTVIVTSPRTPALPLAPQSTPPLIPWTETVLKRFQRSRPPWASIANCERSCSTALYILFICIYLFLNFTLAEGQGRHCHTLNLFLFPSIRE